jgi:hypothetical protein
MDVSEILRMAWRAVEDAELPDEVRQTAFREAVRLMGPQLAVPVSPTPPPVTIETRRTTAAGGPDAATQRGRATTLSENEFYEKLTTNTGVEKGKLERIVHIEGDVPQITLTRVKLERSMSKRAQAVAQILSVARLFGLNETETSLDVIRDECERLKVYDSKNFSTHMRGITGFQIKGGATKSRRVKALETGIKAFPTLVDSLLGEP